MKIAKIGMKISQKAAIVALGLALPMMFAATAQAQFSTGSSAPINISADNADYQGTTTILKGGVDVRQGDVRVLTDKMTIISEAGGSLTNNGFNRVVAQGNFYYLTPEQNVRGNMGVYTRSTDTFVVTGDVILKQEDGNVITGDKLFYNLSTKNVKVVGTCKGRKCGSKGRVNILIKNAQTTTANNS